MKPVDTNPKARIGALKVPLHLVPASARHHLALAFDDGARKYGPFNWRIDPVSASTYIGAIGRHVDEYFDGEDIAADSKVHHLAHVMACCAIVLDALSVGTLVDDRPPNGASPRLHAEYHGAKTVTAKDLHDETQVRAERENRVLTNRERDVVHEKWRVDYGAPAPVENSYLASFGPNPPNCDGNRHPMQAEADRLTGKGE